MTEIKLTKNIKDIRAIYYRNNNQQYYFGPNTKKQSLLFTVVLILFPFFAIYTFNLENKWFFVSVLICFIVACYSFWKVVKPIIVWKKSIENFLKRIEIIDDFRFKYNEDYFIHIEGKEELKQSWDLIKQAVLNDKFIWLFSDTNILLPKSAMSENEYLALSKLISDKVKYIVKN